MQRIWAEAGLKPHLTAKFKVSNDPQFEEKLTDIVGLYMNPPDHALVLSVDEKSQIQASTARNRACRSRRVAAPRRRTTTSATARRRSTRRWT